MRSHLSTPTLVLHTTTNLSNGVHEEEDAFLTPQDEKDLAAGILCLSSGGKGKGRLLNRGQSTPALIIPKASVSFSPHLRTHPYNPTLRVSTSLKPLPSQQYHLSPSPNPSQTRDVGGKSLNDRTLQEREPIPQLPGTPSSTPPASHPGHPKSILKSRPDQRIRVAKTVEMGTKRNCEDAKMSLGVGGRVDGGSDDASGSEGEGVGGRGSGGKDDGKMEGKDGGMTDDDGEGPQDPGTSAMQLDGREESGVDSLLDIIIGQGTDQDAFDLVSIGEAYDTLLVKMRLIFQTKPMGVDSDDDYGDENMEGEEEVEEWKRVIKSIKIRVEGLLKAFKRDVGSLVGTELPPPRPVNDGSSSPSAPSNHIRPPTILPDTPSPQSSPSNIFDSPTKPRKKGYTAAEIQYRRAQANVGQECLKFLAFVFYRREIFGCFTNADLLVLLQAVLLIPITLKLHTPNPKKSYALAVYALTHLKLPVECVLPVKEKMLRALSSAVGEIATKHWGGGPGKKEGEGGNVRARVEGFSATQQVLVEYPEVFGLEHGVLLPLILKGLCNPVANVRIKATGSLGALIRGRMSWSDKVMEELKGLLGMDVDEDQREELEKRRSKLRADLLRIRTGTKECEVATTRLLFEKQISRIAGSPVPPAARRLWDRIARFMTESMKTSPHWSCSTWASLVTLMGDGYMQQENYRAINLTVLQLVHDFKNNPSAVHPQFCRMAWDHAIHAATKQNSIFGLDVSLPITRYQPQSWHKHPGSEVIYVTILAVKKLLEHGEKLGRTAWDEESQAVDLATLRNCLASLESVIYGLSGAIQRTLLPKTALESQQIKSDLTEEEFRSLLFDKLYQETLGPLLLPMLSVKGLNEVRIKAYDVLSAITAPLLDGKLASWNLDRLLHPAFFGLMPGSEFPASTREESLTHLAATHSERHAVATSEVPGWGAHWVARAFAGQLIPTFEKALRGAHELEDGNIPVEWVKSEEGLPLIPVQLSGIWTNMVTGLASGGLTDDAVLLGGVTAITRLLGNIVTRQEPRLPSSAIDRNPQQPSSLRMSLMAHLLDIAISALGESAFADTTSPPPTISAPNYRNAASPTRDANLSTAFHGVCSAANFILDRLHDSYEANLRPSNDLTTQYINLCKRLVMLNLYGNDSSRFVNLVEALPRWQNMASAVELWLLIGDDLISLKPSARTSDEVLTCVQAVTTYLAMPFRSDSAWWTSASYDAERVGNNFKNVFRALSDVGNDHSLPDLGVLEALASRLAEQSEKPESKEPTVTLLMVDFLVSAMDITLCKLDSMPIRVVAEVPVNFLGLANNLLCDIDNRESQQQADHPVLRLLEQCVEIAERAEVSLLPALWGPLQEGLVQWLRPSDDDWFAEKLDDVYIRVLGRISEAMQFGHIPINSESLARYSDLFALRVVSSHEERVIAAFQNFWNSTFTKVDSLEYSDDLKEFFRSFMEADSQFLVVPGLEPVSQPGSSSVDSVAYYADVSREVQDDQRMEPTAPGSSIERAASLPLAAIEGSQPEAPVVTSQAPAEQIAVAAHTAITPPTSPAKRHFEETQPSVNKRRASSVRSAVAIQKPEEDIVPDSQPSTLSTSPSKSQRSLRKGASGTILGAVGAMSMAMGRIIPGLVWRSPPQGGSLAELPDETSLAGPFHDHSSPMPRQSSQKRKAPSSLAEADEISVEQSSQEEDTRPPITPMKRREEVSVVIPVRPKRRRIGKDVRKSITSIASVESEGSSFASGASREATPSGDAESSRDVELPKSKKSNRSRKRSTRSVSKATSVPNRQAKKIAVPQVEVAEPAAEEQRTILHQEVQPASREDPAAARRTAQVRLLALIAEAASLSEGAEDMDMLGITDLLDDLENIRGSAMRGLRKHAQDDKLRRSKSVGGI